MTAAIKSLSNISAHNPLNDFEDLLESSGYDYDRVTKTRLQFDCDGKQGAYGIVLEWNEDAKIIKLSLVIDATRDLPGEQLERCIEQTNESSWHGFFMADGVGNSIFKGLVKYNGHSHDEIMEAIETIIDQAIREADRFSITLALSNEKNVPSLFQKDNDISIETMTLMFSDIKGNA